MSTQSCHGCGVKHKKFLIVLGLISFAVAVVIVGVVGLHQKYAGGRAGMMGGYGNYGRGTSVNNITYAVPTPVPDQASFVAPSDAAKTGELAITVGSIDVAKKAVADVAAKNDGSVYSSVIAYASNDIKNGSMVVQVPIEKFDSAFDDLRSVGSQVVEESTQQVEKRNFYPTMTPASGEVITPQEKNVPTPKTAADNGSVSTSVASPAIAIYPGSQQQVQDKGYVKVVFAVYGAQKGATYDDDKTIGNMLNNPAAEQDLRKVLLVGFAIKLALLLTLLFLLGFVFKKMIGHFRAHRKAGAKTQTRLSEKKSVAHVVRQAPKKAIRR